MFHRLLTPITLKSPNINLKTTHIDKYQAVEVNIAPMTISLLSMCNWYFEFSNCLSHDMSVNTFHIADDVGVIDTRMSCW